MCPKNEKEKKNGCEMRPARKMALNQNVRSAMNGKAFPCEQ